MDKSDSDDGQRRFPKALIIGFSKCGTTALRAFVSLHPDIVSPLEEIRFFTLNYTKGLEWYRLKMPPSSESQITIEKTPFYIMDREALQRIREFNASIKLIISVRDPIGRLQSQYAHTFRNVHDPADRPSFKSWCQGDAFSEHVVRFVDYASHISAVYDLFPKSQILVLSEEALEMDPLSVMKEAEMFLGLRASFSKYDFVFNKDKGFYCFNMTSPNYPNIINSVKLNPDTGCIGGEKGRAHPEIEEDFFKQLVRAIRPHNEQLFSLIGKRFDWDNFKEL
ncbi:hypothetical protein RRG08_041575 [Elysia crispata]|uniref:Sulfotransferase domain-containing protein n=1 Tax=Elysia crispata TaxID=231223 RepID=A0AAE1E6J9_9GAST|nr:hypothetical protein RRG08_041575 [Elysia crispata]